MESISSLNEIFNINIESNVITLDVFDTLLYRRFLSVNQVHDLVSAYSLTLLGEFGRERPEDITKTRYVITDNLKTSYPEICEEPTLKDVWLKFFSSRLKDKKKVEEFSEKVAKFEFDIEDKNIYLIKGVAQALKNLKDDGIKLFAISDMYFSHKEVSHLLEKEGILHFFENVYVSADKNLTKQTGNLFRYVWRENSLEPKQVCHIGDNPNSDVTVPQLLGADAVLVKQEHLCEIEPLNYGERKNIFDEIIDLVKLFICQIYFSSQSMNVQSLYFMSRDGIIMRHVLEKWNLSFFKNFFNSFHVSDLCLSRASTCWINIDFSKENWLSQAIGHCFWLYHGQITIQQLSDMLGVSKSSPLFPQDRVYYSDKDKEFLIEAYRSEGLETDIKNSLIEKRKRVFMYLDSIGFFDNSSISIADVGYSGTVLRDLNTFFLQISNDIRNKNIPDIGFYCIASNGNYAVNAEKAKPYVHFQHNVILPEEHLPSELKDTFAWLEYFFKHPFYGPLTGYILNSGSIKPNYNKVTLDNKIDHPFFKICSLVEEKPEDIVLMWMASVGCFEHFRDKIVERFREPDLDTVVQLSEEIYETNAVHGQNRGILYKDTSLSDWELREEARRHDCWISGSLVLNNYNKKKNISLKRDDISYKKNKFLSCIKKMLGRKEKEFDPIFYRSMYPELAFIRDDANLEKHFREHGHILGRCGTEKEWSRFREKASFSFSERRLDLEKIRIQKDGTSLSKGYEILPSHVKDEFEKFITEGCILLSEREKNECHNGVPAIEIVFNHFGVILGEWVELFNPVEFRSLNYQWCGDVKSYAEALFVFLKEGIKRCAPISSSFCFDPNYYCKTYPELKISSNEEAYIDWLNSGYFAGRLPAEHWQLKEKNRFWNKSKISIKNSEMWVDDARSARANGQLSQAYSYMKRVLKILPDRGDLWHEMGDWYLFDQLDMEALDSFEKGINTSVPNPWSYIHAVTLNAKFGYYSKALYYLDLGMDVWKASTPWRRAKRDLFRIWFDCEYQRYVSLFPSKIPFLVDRIAEAMERIGFPKKISIVPDKGHIVVLLPITVNSRVFVDNFWRNSGEKDDRQIISFSREKLFDFVESFIGASLIVFNHVDIDSFVLEAALLARSLGIKTIFWAGPLSVEGKSFLPDFSGLDLSSFQILDGRVHFNSDYKSIALAKFCDISVTTVPSLGPALRHLGNEPYLQKSRFLSSLDDMKSSMFHGEREAFAKKELKILCFMQGRPFLSRKKRSKEESFSNQICQRDIIKIICDLYRKGINFKITVEGFDEGIIIPSEIKSIVYKKRFEDTDNERIALMASADLVLDFRQSEVDKRTFWVDGSYIDVPVVQLDQGNAKNFPALSTPQSVEEIGCIIEDILSSSEVRNKVLEEQKELFNQIWSKHVLNKEDIYPISPLKREKRILFANIFSPPQVIGGATRVLSDNLDYFRNYASEEFTSFVLASDDQNDSCGEKTVDTWNGIPVFRIATPQEVDMNWRGYNSEVELYTRRVINLVKPDLVHIHCLTRLSIAVAEVCKAMRVPYIVTLHDAWWVSDFAFLVDEEGRKATLDKNPANQSYSHRIGLSRSLERAVRLRSALLGARKILGVSEAFSQLFRKIGFDVETVENGVSSFHPKERVSSRARVRLGHLGGLEHHKGAYLVEAALRLYDFKHLSLMILDHGYHSGASKKVVWGTTPVEIRGPVPSSEVSDLYANIDVLIAPSTWPESYGLVAREASICGCWVIANEEGAMGQNISPGENGFIVNTDSPDDLLNVLKEIDQNYKKYIKSPNYIGKQRSASDQARDLIGIYKSII